MKNIILLLSFTFACLAGYGRSGYVINGTTPSSNNGRTVLLVCVDDKGGINVVESARVMNGRFRFEGNAYPNSPSVIAFDRYSPLYAESKYSDIKTDVILESGAISVVLDSVSRVSGTPLNNLMQEYKGISRSDVGSVVDFVKLNSSNMIGRKAFMDYMQRMSDDDVEQILATNPSIGHDEKIGIQLTSRKIVQQIRKDEKMRQQLKGAKYRDFELFTAQGDTVRLSDYVGRSKYLVINFWASWSAPCIASTPQIKAIALKYKEKDVEFIGISVDKPEDRIAWSKTVQRIDTPWPQLSDLTGTRGTLAKAYVVGDIPYAVIIARDGTILEFVRFPDRALDGILDKLP